MSWREDIRQPATLIAIFFGVLGVLASFYFYVKSEKVARISMSVEQVQAYDSSPLGSLALKIIDAFGNQVTANVYVAVVTIWNSGDLQINPNDVRRNYFLRINKEGLIPLDVSPIQYSNGNMDGFEIQSNGQLTWKNFDPGEGIKVRVVYANENKLSLFLIGTAPGVSQIFTENSSIDELKNSSKILIFMSTYLITIVSLCYLSLVNIRKCFLFGYTYGRLTTALISTSAVIIYVFLWIREIAPIMMPHAPPI